MGFLTPGNEQVSGSATPAPAAQAMAKFKAQILASLLDAQGQGKPSFAQYASGASYPGMPQGLGGGIGSLLEAMNQPGAFTSTDKKTTQPASPSTLSDLVQMAVVGSLLTNMLSGTSTGSALGGGLSGIKDILMGVGGKLGIPGTDPQVTANQPGWGARIDAGTGYPSLGPSDQMGFTSEDPGNTTGIDPALLDYFNMTNG